jgi:hypothetical protein
MAVQHDDDFFDEPNYCVSCNVMLADETWKEDEDYSYNFCILDICSSCYDAKSVTFICENCETLSVNTCKVCKKANEDVGRTDDIARKSYF